METANKAEKKPEIPATILVVDDDSTARFLLEVLLTHSGYQVVQADCGEAALQKIKENAVSMVFLDIHMPGMTGIEVCREIRHRFSLDELPVILLTAVADQETLTAGFSAGANDYIIKPFSQSTLLARTKVQLSLSAKTKALRQAQVELERSKESFHNVVEVAADGVIVELEHGAIVYANKSALTLLGKNSDELIGEKFGLPMLAGLTTEVKTTSKLGEKGVAELFVVTSEWEGKKAFVGMLRDITKRHKLMRDLDEAKEKATVAAQAKSEFLANMSHEIRTPLTAIIGFADAVLHAEHSGSELQSALQRILRNSNHLLHVINEILDFSKVEANRLVVENIECDLHQLLWDLEAGLQLKAAEKGISFGLEFMYPLPKTFRSDPTRLKQILFNLIGNAIKFTSVGGVKVLVTYETKASTLTIKIIDTGIGMTEEQTGGLFKAFSQADTSTTRQFGGTGLGLVISKRLAKLLGGDITLSSAYGQGSMFVVTVPVDSGGVELLTKAPLQDERIEKLKEFPRVSGRVLLAEDGEDNRDLITFLLHKIGLEVSVVENGKLAVDAALNGNFDLVLMDMQMPEMDGYSATRMLRHKGFTTPIIAVTASTLAAPRNKCVEAGCNDAIRKPFRHETFYSKLYEYIKNPGAAEFPAPMPVEPVFSGTGPVAAAMELLRGKPDLATIVQNYVCNLPEKMRALQVAHNSNNWAEVRMIAHRLKGAELFGFPQLGRCAETLENHLKAGEHGEPIISSLTELFQLSELIDSNKEQLFAFAKKHCPSTSEQTNSSNR